MPKIEEKVYNKSMPNDFFNINALAEELNAFLTNGKILRISQPEKDEITLALRAGGENKLLVISANPNSPRLHLSTQKKENPYMAPPFAMLLRKHLVGGKITSVSTVAQDRIVLFEISGRNELADETALRLYVELMGRYSNIILTDEEDVIFDALRHIPPDEKQLRCILPKVKYLPPSQGKISPISDGIALALSAYCGGNPISYLLSTVSGFANSTAYELFFRLGIPFDVQSFTSEECEAIEREIHRFATAYHNDLFAPCSDGKDFYLFPYTYNGQSYTSYPNFNCAVDELCSEKDRLTRLKTHGKRIATAIKSAETKAERLIKNGYLKLEECKNADQYRLYGDILTCNLGKVKKGATKALLFDYENGQEISIPLDGKLSPVENAQAFYKKYAKQKRTIEFVKVQLEEQKELLEYIRSIKTAFELAEQVGEFEEIERELEQNGFLKPLKQREKKKKDQPLSPAVYTIDGYTAYRGKNNLQNDYITFKVATSTDLWFHVKDAHGSHVVLFTKGATPPDEVIEKCASLAAFYSTARENPKVRVDYTQRKNVSRHPNKKIGMVIYTKYNSITVTPKNIDK